jgi:hypothetical protein
MFPNLRAVMSDRGVRLYHLAAHLRVSDGYLCQRLAGRRPFQDHERRLIAQYFCINPDWLFAPLHVPASARRETATLTPVVESR